MIYDYVILALTFRYSLSTRNNNESWVVPSLPGIPELFRRAIHTASVQTVPQQMTYTITWLS